VIENILDKVNHMIIGGGMTFTFVKALGGKIGNSICEDDKLDLAIEILKQAKEKGVQIHIPVDVVAADACSNDANTQIVDVNQQLKTGKIGRNDAKVDLLMQDKEERFLVAEGKRSYANFFSSAQEKIKIHNAFKNISKIIDDLYASKNTKKITSLICMLDVPALNSDFFLDQERRKIVESIKLGHVSEITDEEFVVIGVYVLNSKTLFELFFSQGFDENVANMLRENFGSK
jgi:hypothetical protein